MIPRLEQTVNGWGLRWWTCTCGDPECDTGMLFIRAPDRPEREHHAPWMVGNVGADWEGEEQLRIAAQSLLEDEAYREACGTLAQAFGWPWHRLTPELVISSYVQMMAISQEVSDELRFWGPVGARGLRRLAGPGTTSMVEALECLHEHRLDVGGEQVPGGIFSA